jgi:uncharacterized tellurite resistance protein B-like protein
LRIAHIDAPLTEDPSTLMSDKLGMKAVNRVAETDRLPFVKALAHIAVADDSVTLDEKQMVNQYADAWNLADSAQAQVRDILRSGASISLNELVSEFSESGTRFLLMQELMRLSYADGTYGDAERKEIAAIAQRMGMTEDQFREVEKWVGRGQAWDVPADEIETDEEDLQRILDREGDDEYDLSDIETGDSELDDIDPGGYDLDEEDLTGEDVDETDEDD